jgi:hypothetical protein
MFNKFITLFLLGIIVLVVTGCGSSNMSASISAKEWSPEKGGDECWRCHTAWNETKNGEVCSSKEVGSGDFPDDDCGLLPPDFSHKGYECTKSMCTSLGKDCEFVESDDKGTLCLKQSLLGIDLKIYNPNIVCGDGSNCNFKKEEYGVVVTDEIKPFTDVNFSFKTRDMLNEQDYASKCYYTNFTGLDVNDIDETAFFGDQNFNVNHLMIIKAPTASVGSKTKHTYYITCEDEKKGKRSIPPYKFEFEVGALPDVYAPIITFVQPEKGFFKFNEMKPLVNILIYEDGIVLGCKFGFNSFLSYDNMTDVSDFGCKQESGSMFFNCSGRISNVSSESKSFYFKCIDSEGNVNTESKEYVASFSDELKIDSILCTGTETGECSGKTYNGKVNISLYSSGGAENGKARCAFKLNDYSFIDFKETDKNDVSYQYDLSLKKGVNKLSFRCKDSVGNVVKNETELEYEMDETAPELMKIYSDVSFVYLITSEKTNCKYSKNIPFDYEDAADVSTADRIVHMVPLETDSYFVVKCKDEHGNSGEEVKINVVKKN